LEGITVVVAFVLAYSLLSRRLATTVITGPMAFVAFGILVGPEGLDVVDLRFDNALVATLAKATLILILFNDAAQLDWPTFWRNRETPVRLLAIGLPLMIIGGALIAALMFDEIEFWQAGLIGVLLAPTDAALGQAVVTNKKVPLLIRQSLSTESGLNDGIVAPLVPLFLAGAVIVGVAQTSSFWLDAIREISFGLVIGAAGGVGGAILIGRAWNLGWMSRNFQQISVFVLPLLIFGLSDLAHANHFVAAFVAGIVFGNVTSEVSGRFFEFSENGSQLLLLLTFMIFGGVFAGPALDQLDWRIALYAALSLLLVRPLTVAVSMIGSGFRPSTVAFLGWFGPRGLASIVFAFLVLEEEGTPGADQIFLLVAWTVLISVFAHGLTAQLLANRYGQRAETFADQEGAPELDSVERFFRSAARLSGSTGHRSADAEDGFG
jgi:NhaP-type Na+/H+ or K+/H+ antiporter